MLKTWTRVTHLVMELRWSALPRPPAPKRRRRPVDWRRYATHARRAQRRLPRYEHPLVVTAVASLVFAFAGLGVLQALGVGLGSGLRDLGGSIESALPRSQGSELVLGETQVVVSAAPILDALPDFTKTNEVRVAGKVPSFALRPQRQIVVTVNGKAVGTYPIDEDGRFGGAPLTLADGPSTITATLVDGAADIASASQTVVVDRVPPAIEITRPKASDTIEGAEVLVEGKTEAGADVTVNDRALRPNPDGTFSERIAAKPGPLALTILARDKAGNETKTQLSITVKEKSPATAAGTVLQVSLDRSKVRPGETVVAKIVATDSGKPKANLAVTLQVGVTTIGTYKTDAGGAASVGFAAPDHEADDVAIVVLGGGTAARATLAVSTK